MSGNHLFLIDTGYFLAALMFVIGLHRMTSAKRMRSGLWCAGAGLVLALLATLIQAELSHNHLLMMSLFPLVVVWLGCTHGDQ